jgi:hypothetical protein
MPRLNAGISAAEIFSKLTGEIFAHRRVERKFGWSEAQLRWCAIVSGGFSHANHGSDIAPTARRMPARGNAPGIVPRYYRPP